MDADGHKRAFIEEVAPQIAVALVAHRWDEMQGDYERVSATALAVADQLWEDLEVAAPWSPQSDH